MSKPAPDSARARRPGRAPVRRGDALVKTPRRRASVMPPALGRGFSFDAEREIWLAANHEQTFAYSDGESAESALLATMTGASDRRVGSAELESAIHDWVTRYHLSANRAN